MNNGNRLPLRVLGRETERKLTSCWILFFHTLSQTKLPVSRQRYTLVKPSGLLLLDVFILPLFSWEMQQKCSWSGTRCKWCTKRSRAIWGLRQCTHHNGGCWSCFLYFNFRQCAYGVFSSRRQWLSSERVCWWVRCCLICPLRQPSQLLRLSDWTEAQRPGKWRQPLTS